MEVLEVGAEVKNVKSGDRCSVEPYMNNAKSFASRRGFGNCCQDLQVLGVHTDGGLRERFVVRADKLHPSTRLSYEAAGACRNARHRLPRRQPSRSATRQPLAHHWSRADWPIRSGIRPSWREATITVMDMNAERLEVLQAELRSDEHVLFRGDSSELDQMREITGGELYPTVLDATGSAASMNQALNYVAHAGTLVYVGITPQDITFPDRLFHSREMTLKASRNALPDDFRRIIKLIEDRQIDTNRWITHRTAFDEVIDVFESYTKPETGVIKAIIEIP